MAVPSGLTQEARVQTVFLCFGLGAGECNDFPGDPVVSGLVTISYSAWRAEASSLLGRVVCESDFQSVLWQLGVVSFLSQYCVVCCCHAGS
ncbi:MAG: hypothetical protein R3C01_02460 [Planctomycetaceae bacterium]